ncbi:MAG TPA: PD-(D/E)XK nuclease-like domain-containing protein [Desulfosporosinus sp.]|nr:PD-(D/E)XK nuclease-like domain-containing protein [Desulfosporosinus sp.]
MLNLTQDNYHSLQANLDYMSRSQYVGFVYECEAKEIAKLSDDWVDVPTTAQEVGRYVHSWSAGTQDEFTMNHRSMFTRALTLRAEYLVANTMIDCLQEDPFVMSYLDGEKEKIMTAEMYGTPWKIMINVHSLVPRRLVDLRTARSIITKVWDEAARRYVSFVELYKTPLQVAIYSEVERLAMGRGAEDWSEFIVVAVSKEKYPDKAVLNMTNPTRLATELAAVQTNMPRLIALKAGLAEPIRCEVCNYCRSTKVLNKVIQYY